MAMQGADVAGLRALAKQFNSSASQLNSMGAQLSTAVQATQAWKGGDAQRFRSDWQSRHRQQLNGVVEALRLASKELDKNATEQEQASDGATGSIGGGSGDAQGKSASLWDKFEGFVGGLWKKFTDDWPKYAIKAVGGIVGWGLKKLIKDGIIKLALPAAASVPIVGGIVAGVVAGAVQWYDDRDQGFSTGTQIGRIIVKGVATGVGSGLGQWGGAALGGLAGGLFGGAAGAPTGPGAAVTGVGGAAIGATIGGMLGGAAGGWLGGMGGDWINDRFLNGK